MSGFDNVILDNKTQLDYKMAYTPWFIGKVSEDPPVSKRLWLWSSKPWDLFAYVVEKLT